MIKSKDSKENSMFPLDIERNYNNLPLRDAEGERGFSNKASGVSSPSTKRTSGVQGFSSSLKEKI